MPSWLPINRFRANDRPGAKTNPTLERRPVQLGGFPADTANTSTLVRLSPGLASYRNTGQHGFLIFPISACPAGCDGEATHELKRYPASSRASGARRALARRQTGRPR